MKAKCWCPWSCWGFASEEKAKRLFYPVSLQGFTVLCCSQTFLQVVSATLLKSITKVCCPLRSACQGCQLMALVYCTSVFISSSVSAGMSNVFTNPGLNDGIICCTLELLWSCLYKQQGIWRLLSSSRLPACPAKPAAGVPGSHGNAAAAPKPEPDE